MEIRFWDREIETLDREKLEALQLRKFRNLLEWALKTPFYQGRLKGIELGDIRTAADIARLPFTEKNDLREAYPYGMLSIPKSEVVRVHASSGTTGTPTVIYLSQNDLSAWTDLVARCITCTGCGPEDVFQNMMTYGLFTGGIGLHYGGEKTGMMVIPASSGNTKRQFKMMKDFQTTVVHATPSYLLHMFSKLEEEGISLTQLNLKKAFVGAEPHSEDVRRKIEKLFDMDVYNSYGLSEMNGPGVSFECQLKNGMHVWEDAYILEVIDPDTLQPVPDGTDGELVLTNLTRTATPIIRYRTRDLTRVIPGECGCGRTHRRIARIKGRTDDMLIINGVNVFPSQIEEVIMRMPEVGTNYLIIVEKSGALDRLIVKTEVGHNIFSDDSRDMRKLADKIKENLRASITINPVVELHEPGRLPVTEGKAVRVKDLRSSD